MLLNYIYFFILGALSIISVELIILAPFIENIVLIIYFSIYAILVIPTPIIYSILHKKIKAKNDKESQEIPRYTTPFPDIDNNVGQSAIIQGIMDSLYRNYNCPGTLDVNNDGKIIIGANMLQEDGSYNFIEISELYLTPPDMDVESLDWKVASARIIENFEDACKRVLGDYKNEVSN